jgi:hypothetical protein
MPGKYSPGASNTPENTGIKKPPELNEQQEVKKKTKLIKSW